MMQKLSRGKTIHLAPTQLNQQTAICRYIDSVYFTTPT